MKIFFVFLIFLFIANFSFGAVSNDVILEKIDTINTNIKDLKVSFESAKTSSDAQIKEINSDIVDIQLCQAAVDSKINIIWGIFGATFGGSIVYGGVSIQKKRNGKTNGDKTE